MSSFTPKPVIKLKPWGREVWWADTEAYAGKILEVNAGARLSLQFHRWKMETMYLISGEVKMHYGDDVKKLKVKTLKPGMTFHVPPGTIHRIEGVALVSALCEVSTPHLTDVVRLQDDYRRPDEGNHDELDKKLNKQAKKKS